MMLIARTVKMWLIAIYGCSLLENETQQDEIEYYNNEPNI